MACLPFLGKLYFQETNHQQERQSHTKGLCQMTCSELSPIQLHLLKCVAHHGLLEPNQVPCGWSQGDELVDDVGYQAWLELAVVTAAQVLPASHNACAGMNQLVQQRTQ